MYIANQNWRVIWYQQLSWWRKLATAKSVKTGVSSLALRQSEWRMTNVSLWRRAQANARNVNSKRILQGRRVEDHRMVFIRHFHLP